MFDFFKGLLLAGLAGFALVAFTPIVSLGNPAVQDRATPMLYPVFGAVVLLSLIILGVMALRGRSRLGEYDEEE